MQVSFSFTWPIQHETLAEEYPELARQFRVVAMDVRGHGKSGKTDDGHSFGQYARDAYYWRHA